MKTHGFRAQHRPRNRTAFSLVEMAFALGIVGFALVGVVGVIPLAMNNGRQSVAQSRAASVAGAVFAGFRTQPFAAVPYLDGPPGAPAPADAVDLNTRTTGDGDRVVFFAAFDEVPADAPSDDARRLHFLRAAPVGTPGYQVVLRFNNHPAGTLAPYLTAAGGPLHAQANGIEASVCEIDHPGEVFRFASVIANRTD